MGLLIASTIIHPIAILTCLSLGIRCQELDGGIATGRLAEPTVATSAIYDGMDTIYIFGGLPTIPGERNPAELILKYKLSSDTLGIFTTGEFLGWNGAAIPSPSGGDILYIAQRHNEGFPQNAVYTFRPSTSQLLLSNVSLPQLLLGNTMVKPTVDSDQAYIFGNYGANGGVDINLMDLNTFNVTKIGELPRNYANPMVVSDGKGNAYIFGDARDFHREAGSSVLRIDLDTLEVFTGPPDFPLLNKDYKSGAVWDGRHIYVVAHSSSIGAIPAKSIIRFDPETFTHTVLSVAGDFPASNNGPVRLSGSTIVYAERMNRIYLLGGNRRNESDTWDGGHTNQIWYLDLPPRAQEVLLNPTAT